MKRRYFSCKGDREVGFSHDVHGSSACICEILSYCLYGYYHDQQRRHCQAVSARISRDGGCGAQPNEPREESSDFLCRFLSIIWLFIVVDRNCPSTGYQQLSWWEIILIRSYILIIVLIFPVPPPPTSPRPALFVVCRISTSEARFRDTMTGRGTTLRERSFNSWSGWNLRTFGVRTTWPTPWPAAGDVHFSCSSARLSLA